MKRQQIKERVCNKCRQGVTTLAVQTEVLMSVFSKTETLVTLEKGGKNTETTL